MAISPNVISAIETGQKISAIKIFREETGATLTEAKEAIDQFCAEHPELVGSNKPAPSPEQAKLKGQAILFVIIVIAMAIYSLTR